MKSLFDQDHLYTEEAEQLRLSMDDLLRATFYNYCIEDMYSPREVAHILNATINEFEELMINDWRERDRTMAKPSITDEVLWNKRPINDQRRSGPNNSNTKT